MNLEKEMLGECDNANNWNSLEVGTARDGSDRLSLILLHDAIKIAKQAIEDACKRQKQIIINRGKELKNAGFEITVQEIEGLPLATEEK